MKSNYNHEIINELVDKIKKGDKPAIKTLISIQPTYDHNLTNELIYKVKQGDVQAKEELICLHKDFIQVCIDKVKEKATTQLTDELVEAAKIGFIQAALHFEEGIGFAFMAYSMRFINKRIVEEVLNLHPRAKA